MSAGSMQELKEQIGRTLSPVVFSSGDLPTPGLVAQISRRSKMIAGILALLLGSIEAVMRNMPSPPRGVPQNQSLPAPYAAAAQSASATPLAPDAAHAQSASDPPLAPGTASAQPDFHTPLTPDIARAATEGIDNGFNCCISHWRIRIRQGDCQREIQRKTGGCSRCRREGRET